MGVKKSAPTVQDYSNRFERDAHTIIKTISSTDIVKGRLIENIALTTATTNVAHGLDRVPKGWVVVDRDAGFSVFRDATVTTQRDRFLAIKAAGNVTVSIWVF